MSKNVCVLTSEEKSENITVIACMLLFCMSISAPCSNSQGLHQETGVRWWLTPRVRCVNLHEPEIDFFILWFTEHFLKHKASGRFILFLDSHRAPYYCYRLLLKIRYNHSSTESRYSYLTAFGYVLFWAFKSLFKNETAAYKITRYRMAPFGVGLE